MQLIIQKIFLLEFLFVKLKVSSKYVYILKLFIAFLFFHFFYFFLSCSGKQETKYISI